MPLTEKESFKVGFLLKCAEQGLTIEETNNRVKKAIEAIKHKDLTKTAIPSGPFNLGGKIIGGGLGLLKGLLSWGAGGAVVGATALGAGTGFGLAKLRTGNKGALEDAKQDEIINEYERLANEARRRSRLKQLQEQTGKRIVALTPEEY